MAQNVTFLPLAVCAYGGWLDEGSLFVKTLAGRVAEATGVQKGIASGQLWQRLSLTLWRSNAQTLLHFAPEVEHGTWDVPGYASGKAR